MEERLSAFAELASVDFSPFPLQFQILSFSVAQSTLHHDQ